LTRESLALAFDRPLELRQQELDRIERMFAKRKRSMPPNNRIQAHFPRGSESVFNPGGTAPGIIIDLTPDGPLIVALPGVPAEMHDMWPAVATRVRATFAASTVMRTYCLQCFGIGESHLESRIRDLTVRDRNPLVGITVRDATISLRISARADDEAKCRQLVDQDVTELRQRLGDLVFGEGDEELHHVLIRQLREHAMSLAVAEVGTPGLLTSWLYEADPTGQIFRGSTVVPASRIQGGDATGTLNNDILRSASEYWSSQARRTYEADLGLSIVATSQRKEDRSRSIWIGLDNRGIVNMREHATLGHPDILMPRAAKDALNWLRLLHGK
jgi:nicotinamide-nucleotide amidase